MADIKNLKITEDKTRGKHVADLPVNPTENGMSAQELQGHFDALPEVVIEAFNTLLDYLIANGAGDKITPLSLWAMQNNFGNLTCTDLLEWIDQQPIGGAFNLNPEVTTTGTPVTGSWQKGVFFVNSDDSKTVFICDTSSGHIFYNFSVAIGNWKGWKNFSGDFKSDGSVPMSGSLKLYNGTVRLAGNYGTAQVIASDSDQSLAPCRYLEINSQPKYDKVSEALKLWDAPNADFVGQQSYNIFGTHNKPSGSYTGNGSATKREIAVGGIGSFVHVARGGYGQAFVFTTGALTIANGKVTVLYGDAVYYDRANGKIVCLTNDAVLNANGVEYTYHVK